MKYLSDFLTRMRETYLAFIVSERGLIVRRPRLTEINAMSVTNIDRQCNVLLCRSDCAPKLTPYRGKRRSRDRDRLGASTEDRR